MKIGNEPNARGIVLECRMYGMPKDYKYFDPWEYRDWLLTLWAWIVLLWGDDSVLFL